MKLYHYAIKGNTVLEDGLLSFSKNDKAPTHYYLNRAKSENKQDIINWMETSFEGRSRIVTGLTETIKWHNKSHSLRDFIEGADLFSYDLDSLNIDGLIDAVWCKYAVTDVEGLDEKIYKLNSINEIDLSPLPWEKCNDDEGKRFSVIRHYLVVMKDGYIPPKYITKE